MSQIVKFPGFTPMSFGKVSFPKRSFFNIKAFNDEPSLFSCDLSSALRLGGPLTQAILLKLLQSPGCMSILGTGLASGLSPVIDVRVQRLMPGMFPSIPGWHCDAVPRPGYATQPDFSLINPKSYHWTCILDTSIDQANDGSISYTSECVTSLTEFVRFKRECEFQDDVSVWKQLHRMIEANSHLERMSVEPGVLYGFETLCPHRTIATLNRGWRLFFRLSLYHNPAFGNQVASTQQVYLLSEENGW